MTIKWKVALVEDDRRLARAVATGLGEEGYTVRAVESAGRGLELVRHWNPDVVLLDLMLPDNEGPELFEAFRAETDAALVGISARSSVSDRIAGLKLGADDYVTKPFALEELMARVEAVIRRHRGKGGSKLASADVLVDRSEGRASRGGRRRAGSGEQVKVRRCPADPGRHARGAQPDRQQHGLSATVRAAPEEHDQQRCKRGA